MLRYDPNERQNRTVGSAGGHIPIDFAYLKVKTESVNWTHQPRLILLLVKSIAKPINDKVKPLAKEITN